MAVVTGTQARAVRELLGPQASLMSTTHRPQPPSFPYSLNREGPQPQSLTSFFLGQKNNNHNNISLRDLLPPLPPLHGFLGGRGVHVYVFLDVEA